MVPYIRQWLVLITLQTFHFTSTQKETQCTYLWCKNLVYIYILEVCLQQNDDKNNKEEMQQKYRIWKPLMKIKKNRSNQLKQKAIM